MNVNKIVEKDGRFFVTGKDGTGNLGKKEGYPTREEALKRLREIEFFKSENTDLRVNIRSKLVCNQETIGEAVFEGKKHIVVHGVKHMIGDSVMNKILYPSQAMEVMTNELSDNDSYIAAPSGHPIVNGNYASASDPRSLINHGVGAFHFNWRIVDGRSVSDTAINPEAAKNTEDGRELLQRIENMEDVDISTGVFVKGLRQNGNIANGDEYDLVAKKLILDHSAILLHEEGAKTSEEGVGMFANSRDGHQLHVIESSLAAVNTSNDIESGLLNKIRDFADKKNLLGIVDLIKNNNELSLTRKRDSATSSTNEKGENMGDMTRLREMLKKNRDDVDDLSDDEVMNMVESVLNAESGNEFGRDGKVPDSVNSAIDKRLDEKLKPLMDGVNALNTRLDKKDNTDKEEMITAVVNHADYHLTADDAKSLPLDVLTKMAAKTKTVDSVSGMFEVNSTSSVLKDFDDAEDVNYGQ